MTLDYVAMVPDVDEMGTVREPRFGGPPASRYFLMVDLWIPNSRSIARNDMPLAPGFLDHFPSFLLQEGRLARSDSQRWHGGEFTIGEARLIRLGFLT